MWKPVFAKWGIYPTRTQTRLPLEPGPWPDSVILCGSTFPVWSRHAPTFRAHSLASLRSGSALPPPLRSPAFLNLSSPPGNEVDQHHDQRNHQQYMDYPSHRITGNQAEQPQNNQVSCSFQKRTTSRFVVSKSGQAILAECLRGTGGRCPPDPLGYIALELETAGACQPDQARVGPLFTEVWWRRGQPLTNRPLRWVSTTCVERPCRTCESSAFARPSGFANYKLSAFANYSRPLLLAPRQVKPSTAEEERKHSCASL